MDLHSLTHSPLALPASSKIEDLITLAGQDVEPTSDESMEKASSSLLREHQKLMLQHFGHKDVAILPDHIVQCMLLGVSTSNLLCSYLQ